MNQEQEDSAINTLEKGFERLLESSKLDEFVALATVSEPASNPSVSLMHVRFKENLGNSLALASFLCSQAINYSLSRKRRQALIRHLLEVNASGGADLSLLGPLLTAVRDSFIEFHQKYPSRASEVGEVLAYCIASNQLGAAQVASKMSLKTSGNMPVHGLDGLHAKVENGCLYVYFLESKLSQSANAGVKEFAESASGFGSNDKQYLLDYNLARDFGNLDSLEGDERELAIKCFDILGEPNVVPRRERSIGVVLYKDELFGKLSPVADGLPPGFHEKEFTRSYTKLMDKHQKAALKHLQKNSVDVNTCRIFFVAVPDVNELREKFYNQLGYKPKAVK